MRHAYRAACMAALCARFLASRELLLRGDVRGCKQEAPVRARHLEVVAVAHLVVLELAAGQSLERAVVGRLLELPLHEFDHRNCATPTCD